LGRQRRRPKPTDVYQAFVWDLVITVGLSRFEFHGYTELRESTAVSDRLELPLVTSSDRHRARLQAARILVADAARSIGQDRDVALALIGASTGTKGADLEIRCLKAAQAHGLKDSTYFWRKYAPEYVEAIAHELYLLIAHTACEQLPLF